MDILLDHDASLLLHDEDRYCMVQDMRKEDKTLLVELSGSRSCYLGELLGFILQYHFHP